MNEAFITLADAAKHLPGRGGKAMCVKSIVRRIVKGVRGVKLQAVRNGGLWFTTQAWCEQFINDCTAKATGARPSASGESPSYRRAVDALAGRFGIHVGKRSTGRSRAVHDGRPENETEVPESSRPPRSLRQLLSKCVARSSRRADDVEET